MAGFQPQNIPVKMTSGIDTKSDPKSLQTKLTTLQNASLQSPGQIKKRDGFATLPAPSNGIGIGTFQNELLPMDGNSLFSYSSDTNSLINKGLFQPVNLREVSSVCATSYSQSQPDSAYDPTTGLKCYVYLDSSGTSCNYSIEDSNTGTFLIFNSPLNSFGGNMLGAKVMLLGSNFIIANFNNTGTKPGLNYAYINTATPTIITQGNVINSSGSFPFDLVLSNNKLFFTYGNIAAGTILVNSLTAGFILSSPYTAYSSGSSFTENYVVATTTDSSFNIWITLSFTTAQINFAIVVNNALSSTILTATNFENALNLQNMTLIVNGTIATIYGEVFYQLPSSSNYINVYQVTIGGAVTAGILMIRGVGIASKCFNYNGSTYLFGIYAGGYVTSTSPSGLTVTNITSIEPTYFLINTRGNYGSGQIVSKLAPSLSGSYYTTGLMPEVLNISSGIFSIPYIIETQTNSVSGVVTFQTSVNNAMFSFIFNQSISKNSYGNNLLLASGQLWAYDGKNIVEHGFHIYPENLYLSAISVSGGGVGIGGSSATTNQIQYVSTYEWIDGQGQLHRSAPSIPLTIQLPPNSSVTPVTWTSDVTAGSNIISIPSTPTGIFVGQVISDATNPTAFPQGTYIVKFNRTGPSTLTAILSQPANASHSGDTIQTFDVNKIELISPTLRQTLKQNVSIVFYRTAVNGTIFYRVTSSSSVQTYNGLILNNVTVDTKELIDILPDAAIIGNEQLYTTGNVVENISAPAVSSLATFKNRLVYLSPENPFQWGYSQQVVPGVPVEFNSEFFVENVDQSIGELMAIKQLDDKLILFGPTSKYYVVGQGPSSNGTQNDFSDATKIAGIAGCSNPIAVVEIPSGLMFQDIEKGIYLLDRSFNEQYIGADVEEYNGITITSVQKFETQNKVIFTLNTGVNLIYDWYVGQWEVDPFPAAIVDSCLFQNLFTYIQANGTILQQTPGEFSDNGGVIPIQLQTGWINFAGLEGFGRVWELQIMGTYFSPHTLTITFYNDFSSTPSQVVTIPVLSAPANGYKFRIKILQQKCTSMMVNITESQGGTPGQGFSLSSLAFRVGTKKGLNKLPAGESF